MDVVAVEVIEHHTVHLTFEDGSERIVDLAPYLRGPVFEPVRSDPTFFASVSVDPTIVWPNGADLAPDVLYTGRPSAAMEAESQTR